jgi:ABC-type glycerol-3-phosphate transport system permease component
VAVRVVGSYQALLAPTALLVAQVEAVDKLLLV